MKVTTAGKLLRGCDILAIVAAIFTLVSLALRVVVLSVVGTGLTILILIVRAKANKIVSEHKRPRGLTDQEIAQLQDRLSSLAKNARVELVIAHHRLPDTETSEIYAEQLRRVLEETGFTVSVVHVPFSQIRAQGIVIFSLTGNDFPAANKLASTLFSVLQDSKATPVWKARAQAEPMVKVEIGLNP